MSEIAWAGLAALALVAACFSLHAHVLRHPRPRAPLPPRGRPARRRRP